MGETNSPSVAHVGYDISPLKRVKFKILTTSLNPRQLKENLYLYYVQLQERRIVETHLKQNCLHIKLFMHIGLSKIQTKQLLTYPHFRKYSTLNNLTK